jgi:hypothetical protein
MNFEDALKLMREGEKIRHPNMEPDEYFRRCYVSFIGSPPEDVEEMKARGMSIVKMKGDKPHPNMHSRLPFLEYVDLIEKYPFMREKLMWPTMNLLLIMSDQWEIYNG